MPDVGWDLIQSGRSDTHMWPFHGAAGALSHSMWLGYRCEYPKKQDVEAVVSLRSGLRNWHSLTLPHSANNAIAEPICKGRGPRPALSIKSIKEFWEHGRTVQILGLGLNPPLGCPAA